MICAICGRGSLEEGARVLHGKAICRACVGELAQESPVGFSAGGPDGREEEGGGAAEGGHEPGAGVVEALEAELARVVTAPGGLETVDSISVRREGALFQVTDGYSTVTASAETLMERLRMLPDGAGENSAWWVLADL